MEDTDKIELGNNIPNIDAAVTVDPNKIISPEQIRDIINKVTLERRSNTKDPTPIAMEIARRLVNKANATLDVTVSAIATSRLKTRGVQNPTNDQLVQEMNKICAELGDKMQIIENAQIFIREEDPFSEDSREALLKFLDMEIEMLNDYPKDASTLRTVKGFYAEQLDLPEEERSSRFTLKQKPRPLKK